MKRTKQVNIAPPRLFSCILRALLFALCAQISWACTLNTPDQITNGVPFQVSFTACTVGPTDPGTFQLWDQDTNTLLVSDLVIGSPFSVYVGSALRLSQSSTYLCCFHVARQYHRDQFYNGVLRSDRRFWVTSNK
ncbi:uncharacterized protein EI90DRAFT_1794069 [Cantharellus anzutake]|uniref:uncharacterized protein n=1 Tax=Cantharellus anzutake TaxID=1750568 RepID=UPI00190444C4|nr:uncharacterized protein EI90DRAFT_1794069 [Cantharellus anzutake]KAF8327446.1 hypothetical protein EI90DRAFT_1794069 [Cantharellus anzutake]